MANLTLDSFSDETDEPKAMTLMQLWGFFFLQSLSAFDVVLKGTPNLFATYFTRFRFLIFNEILVFMEWGSWEISSDQNGGDYSFSGFNLDEKEGSVLSGEVMNIGLKLGPQTYRHEKSSYSPVKRSRASFHSPLLPRCQVEGCNLDLASAKDYYRRHRICADHSKSPKVVVAGMERRFCQQCSRFHDLSEFDDRKRSCRRRLSAHNARRRRPHSEDTKLSSTYRRGAHMGYLMNRVSISSPNSTPSSSNFNGGCVDMMSNGGLSDISSTTRHNRNRFETENGFDFLLTQPEPALARTGLGYETEMCVSRVTPRRINHDGLETNSSSINAMVAHHSFPLEAANSWGFRVHEAPSSFDQFIHGHNIALAQPRMPLEIKNTHNTQIPHDHFDYFSSN